MNRTIKLKEFLPYKGITNPDYKEIKKERLNLIKANNWDWCSSTESTYNTYYEIHWAHNEHNKRIQRNNSLERLIYKRNPDYEEHIYKASDIKEEPIKDFTVHLKRKIF